MIITCNNCNKKFNIDSTLITDKGRLLQCASCDHKWFFKKEALENKVNSNDEDINNDSVNIFDQNNSLTHEEESTSDTHKDKIEVDLGASDTLSSLLINGLFWSKILTLSILISLSIELTVFSRTSFLKNHL